MTEELKSKIVWQENKDFGKVCTLTESALNDIINETTKELIAENLKLEAKVRTLEIEQNYCMPSCSKIADLEKQIQIDAEQIRALQKQNGELTDKVKELEKELKFEKSINGEFTAIEKLRELEKENAELTDELTKKSDTNHQLVEQLAEQNEKLTEAKELIENIIRVTWGEGWNYSLDWKVKAEQFLSEVEK